MDARAYFDRFGRAYETGDADAIAAFFALPTLLTRDGVPTEIANADALRTSVEELIGVHAEAAVTRIRAASVVVLEQAEAHTVVRVEWQLDRDATDGPQPPWRYATTYVVLPDERIAAALTHGSPF